MPAAFQGTQLLVYRRGKVVHSAVQGFADVERKSAHERRHRFPHLFDDQADHQRGFHDAAREGRVALDEPVHKYIPEWKNLGVFQAGNCAGIPDQTARRADV